MRSQAELIYLCGRLRDAKSVIRASRNIIFLAVRTETIADRLARRAKIPGEVEWGRESWQVEKSIQVNAEIETEYRKYGAVMINADQPLGEVVDDIIARIA